MSKHDYKYRALATAPVWDWRDEINALRTEFLRPIAKAFMWNFVRSATAVKFPAWMALEALRERLWMDYANVQAGHRLNPELAAFPQEAESDEASNTFDAMVKEYRRTNVSDLLDKIGVDYIERRIGTQGSAKISIEAMFSTTVIDAWATFETLASDLWAAVVDKGPKEIADRVFLSKQLRKPDDQITPQTLHTLEHNLKESPGSWLREVRKVSFQSLDDIKLYYSEAFDKEVRKLFDEVDGGYIVALHAFRNALIHNAGCADKKFVDQVARFPELRDIKAKDKLRLDGELVAKLRASAKNLGEALIQFVDSKFGAP